MKNIIVGIICLIIGYFLSKKVRKTPRDSVSEVFSGISALIFLIIGFICFISGLIIILS
jgi:uncharacterized membrane protein